MTEAARQHACRENLPASRMHGLARGIAAGTIVFLLISALPLHPGALAASSREESNLPSFNWLVCPDASTCYETSGGMSVVATHNGGTTWRRTLMLKNANAISLACPSPNVCSAAAGWGQWVRTGSSLVMRNLSYGILRTTDGGKTWRWKTSGKGHILSLACPTVATCYAVDTGSPGTGVQPVLLVTNNGGTSWTRYRPPLTLQFTAVNLTCPLVSTCYLVSSRSVPAPAYRTPIARFGTVQLTRDGGRTWRVVARFPSVGLLAPTCPDVQICYVIAQPDLFQGPWDGPAHYRILVTRDTGKSWRQVYATGGRVRLAGLSCPAVSACMMGVGSGGGDLGPPLTQIAGTSDGGRHWTRLYSSSDSGIDALACARVSTCYAAFSDVVLRTTNAGRTWSQP